MRVLLKSLLDCEPDAAWRAIRSPEVMREVAWPFLGFVSLERDGFPSPWTPGAHPASVLAFGTVPVGEQVIDIAFSHRQGARIQTDTGRSVSGPLTVVTTWRHSIAISPAEGGGTLYRDQLVFDAGPATLPLWPGYWAFWQWRMARIRRLAPGWRIPPAVRGD
jgi:hypothetical protein